MKASCNETIFRLGFVQLTMNAPVITIITHIYYYNKELHLMSQFITVQRILIYFFMVIEIIGLKKVQLILLKVLAPVTEK